MKKQIELSINGVKREILVAPNELLLNLLRTVLALRVPNTDVELGNVERALFLWMGSQPLPASPWPLVWMDATLLRLKELENRMANCIPSRNPSWNKGQCSVDFVHLV